eukprot:PhM_4_TR14148/c0_g1_i1/m.104247
MASTSSSLPYPAMAECRRLILSTVPLVLVVNQWRRISSFPPFAADVAMHEAVSMVRSRWPPLRFMIVQSVRTEPPRHAWSTHTRSTAAPSPRLGSLLSTHPSPPSERWNATRSRFVKTSCFPHAIASHTGACTIVLMSASVNGNTQSSGWCSKNVVISGAAAVPCRLAVTRAVLTACFCCALTSVDTMANNARSAPTSHLIAERCRASPHTKSGNGNMAPSGLNARHCATASPLPLSTISGSSGERNATTSSNVAPVPPTRTASSHATHSQDPTAADASSTRVSCTHEGSHTCRTLRTRSAPCAAATKAASQIHSRRAEGDHCGRLITMSICAAWWYLAAARAHDRSAAADKWWAMSLSLSGTRDHPTPVMSQCTRVSTRSHTAASPQHRPACETKRATVSSQPGTRSAWCSAFSPCASTDSYAMRTSPSDPQIDRIFSNKGIASLTVARLRTTEAAPPLSFS